MRQHALHGRPGRPGGRDRHPSQGNLITKIRQAREVLGIAARYFDDLEGQFDLLARHQPSYAQVSGFFKALVPDPEEGNPARARNARDELFRLFEDGRGQDIPQIKATTYAAFHAVTEYVDHFRPTRARTEFDRAANRLESAWFGSGARLKQHAFRLALEMAANN